MNFDYLIERKRLKSQLRNWKLIAIIVVAAAAAFFTRNYNLNAGRSSNDKYIAYYSLENLIAEDTERDRIFQSIEKDDNATALVLYINSPGGTVVGSERTYNLIRNITEKKPVVTVMGSMATSGGYMTAIASDYIIAHNGTITGSIGVIMQMPEFTELAEKVGINFHNFKSAILKAAPNPMEKLTPEVEMATMNVINDTHEFFMNLVVERRGLGKDYVRTLADGRVFTGRQAVANRLVDAIGTTEDAVTWLEEERSIDKGLEFVDMNKNSFPSFLEIIMSDMTNKASNALGNLFASFSNNQQLAL